MKDWQRLVGLLLDATGDDVAERGHPIWVRVLDSPEGDLAEAFAVAVSDEREGLLGWQATGDCQAVGVIATGRLRPLRGARSDAVDPHTDALRMACLVTRDGEVAWKMALPDGSTYYEAPSQGRLLDCLRRCFGLPTPPPPASPARLQAVAWLVAIEEQTREARRPLSWSEVARLHPVAQVLETDIGGPCPTLQPGLLRMAGSAWSWEDFRRRAQGGGLEDIIDPVLAGWMDEGMFARWVLSDLPAPGELLRRLRPYLAPSAARRLGHAVQSASLPHLDDRPNLPIVHSGSGQVTADHIPSPTELRELATTDPDRHRDWEIAFHEAGHVVVEVAMGSLPDLVYINDDHRFGDDHVGRTVTRSFAAAGWFPAALPDFAVILASGDVAGGLAVGTELDIDDRVCCILGGEGGGTDDLQLQELVNSMPPVEGEALLRQAYLRAGAILREKWDTVRLISRELVRRRSLTRQDLWDLLDPLSAPQ